MKIDKPNIVFLDAGTLYQIHNLDIIHKLGNLSIYEQTPASLIINRTINADIIITNKNQITKEIIHALPNLKLICVAATGVNNIDLSAAKEKNILVKNVVGYSTQSVAQVTFGHILYLYNHTAHYKQVVESKEYAKSSFFTVIDRPFYELAGKTIGIIGLGNIGREVAKIAKAFGMNVIYHSPSGYTNHGEYLHFELEDLLRESDIISIHTPYCDKTVNLIDENAFAKMKPNSLLIAMSRGGIVNEHALVNALNNNMIKGAALDVYSQEPLPEDHILYQIKDKSKVVFSPHIAWASVEAREELVKQIAKNIEDFLKKGI
jgi:glycerate dehydrogenase